MANPPLAVLQGLTGTRLVMRPLNLAAGKATGSKPSGKSGASDAVTPTFDDDGEMSARDKLVAEAAKLALGKGKSKKSPAKTAGADKKRKPRKSGK